MSCSQPKHLESSWSTLAGGSPVQFIPVTSVSCCSSVDGNVAKRQVDIHKMSENVKKKHNGKLPRIYYWNLYGRDAFPLFGPVLTW